MSAPQYEPGTVAVATVRGVPNVRVFRRYDEWTSANVTCDWIGHDDRVVTDVRPLVVLDLHPAKVREFAVWLRKQSHAVDSVVEQIANQIEAQTRPPVVEPTGLLAVVVDGRGRKWFRWSHDVHTFQPWRLVGAVHTDTEDDRRWDGIAAVEVLFEGLPR